MTSISRSRTPRSGRALRIVAGVLGVLLLALVAFFVVSTFTHADERIHAVHNTAGAVPYLILAAAMGGLAVAPRRNAASMHILAIGAAVSIVAGFLGGDLVTGGYFVSLIVVAVVVALYPARDALARVGRPVWPLMTVAALAAVPAIGYALTQGELQRNAVVPGDPHGELHHYSQMAVTSLALVGTLVAAALGSAGSRMAAWIAGTAFVLFGILSLAFAGDVGAPEPIWSWLAIVAGTASMVAVEWMVRSTGRAGVEAA